MIRASLRLIFVAGVAASVVRASNLSPETGVRDIVLTDIDGNQLSTSDGHVTIITVITRQNQAKASVVGDRVPLKYLGKPRYRLITVVDFQQEIGPFFRPIFLAIIRSRVDAEARRLQTRYSAKHLSRPARQDIFLVADFDGHVANQLGITASSDGFLVFLFDGTGHLKRSWNDVPSASDLAAELAGAEP